MADNVAITAGSGTTVSTEEVTTLNGGAVSAQHVQRIVPSMRTADGTAVDFAFNSGAKTDGTQRMILASDDPAVTALQIMDDWDNAASDGASVSGDVAHDTADAGEPVKIGAKAIAHGTNPTAVSENDRTNLYANRHGIQWVIGGHPNIITRSVRIADATGAQTDASIAGTISAGTKVAVTMIAVTCDAGNTGAVACKLGFGASTIPADSTTGANGVLLDHEGISPGSGIVVGNGSAVIGIGADGEELRLTCEDPVGGFIIVTFSYFTIES